jgi:hypothetical protein
MMPIVSIIVKKQPDKSYTLSMKMKTQGPKFPLALDGDAEEHASGKYLK